MWQHLWAETKACPAARQRPLLDAVREGERVLDWLDTLPPSLVWQELLVIALSSAIALLGHVSGALLPDAAQSLSR